MNYKGAVELLILDIKENDRILVVAPHPDDECIGVGGILAYYPHNCKVLVLTDGRQGQGDERPELVKAVREAELAKEMEAAGIKDYRMLGYEDGTLMKHTDCLNHMDLSAFTKIFVTGIHDGHADHTAACISVFYALRKQNLQTVEVYLYEVHSPLRVVTHILDITDVMESKKKLIQYHNSQLKNLPYDQLARCMAEYRAIQNRMPGRYVEAYTYVADETYLEDASIEIEQKLQKSTLFYWVLTRWMELEISGKSTVQFLKRCGYQRIAVYGYAELGKLLCKELLNTDIQVEYILDKKVKQTEREDLPVYVPQKGLPRVDAVVVTAVYYFDDIEAELLQMDFHNVISFRKLLEMNED